MVELGFFSFALIFILPALAALIPGVPTLFSPFPQVAPGNPAASSVPAYPPWFLLFMYKELDFAFAQSIGPFWSTVIFAGMPLVYLIILPYLDNTFSLKLSDRPIFTGLAITGIFYMIGLSVWGALTPGIQIPTGYALLFFVIPLIIVLPITYLISKYYRKGSLTNRHIAIIGTAPVIGFFAFELGILLPGYFRGDGGAYLEYSIFLAVLIILILLILMKGLGYFKSSKPESEVPRQFYVAVVAILAFFSVFLATIVSVMNPTSITDEAFYSMAIGLIFLSLGAITKIYRKISYKE